MRDLGRLAAKGAMGNMNPLWYPVILTLNVACLMGAGYLIRHHWTVRRDTVPLPVAIVLWAGAISVYIVIAGTLYLYAVPAQKLPVLGWCFLFWLFPMAYFAFGVLDSLATRSVDRIGPLGAQIDDPSEFAAARKLALRGDIDGAVSMYRSYTDNQANALFEAVRLLKSEDRFVEAAMLLNEIVDRFRHITRVWAEATYQLAKLKELSLNEPQNAARLFKEILDRAPESTICQMAGAELARLHQLDKSYYDDETDEEETPEESGDPFYRNQDPRAIRGAGSRVIVPVQPPDAPEKAAVEAKTATPAPQKKMDRDDDATPEDASMPAADPFYAARFNPDAPAASQINPSERESAQETNAEGS